MYIYIYWWLIGKESAFMKVMWVQSLGGEDPLEKEMATHSKSLMDRGTWKATVQDTT